MSDTQLNTYKNDKHKDDLIDNSELTMYRFWGSEIEQRDFESKLIKLWQK